MQVGWGSEGRRDAERARRGSKKVMRDNDQNTQCPPARLPKNKYKIKIKTAMKNNGLPQVRTSLSALTGPSRLEESDDKHASALFS